jgi:hypothetical protein
MPYQSVDIKKKLVAYVTLNKTMLTSTIACTMFFVELRRLPFICRLFNEALSEYDYHHPF